MEATEKNKLSLLTRALDLHMPKKDRHTWAWRQRDKLSTAWLLVIPSVETSLTNNEFSHSAAINLWHDTKSMLTRQEGLIVSMVGLPQIQWALSRRSCSHLREYKGWYLVLLARLVSLSIGSLIILLPAESGWQVPSVAGKVL